MNCRDLNHLLDSTEPGHRTDAQQVAIDAHLSTCRACSEQWADWRALAALPVPAAPASLRARVALALPRQAIAPARRSWRPLLLGGALMAGAVLAAVIVLQSGEAQTGSTATVAEVSPPTTAIDAGAESTTPAPVPMQAEGPSPAATGTKAADAVALDPRSILVLKRPEAAADAQAIVQAEQCHDAIVSQLRAAPGLNLITGSESAREAPFPYPLPRGEQGLARSRGAGYVLTVSTENGCRAQLYDTQTGMPAGGGIYGGAQPPNDGWNLFARGIAEDIRERTLNDPATALARNRSTLLDASLSDFDRIRALSDLSIAGHQAGRHSDAVFDRNMVAAALTLAARATDADLRGAVWVGLREVNDPQMVQPLLKSLVADAEPSVRMQAAYTLKYMLDQPGVRAALQRAAAEDPDSVPRYVCCIDTVREAAERASIPDDEFLGWVRGKLLDESLPARSRLYALVSGMDGRLVHDMASIGEDAAGIVFDIGRREQNPKVRQMAWDALRRAGRDDDFMSVLLADMINHPDENVRSSAAQALTKYADEPEVRAGFERALEDSSVAVRRVASGVVNRPTHE